MGKDIRRFTRNRFTWDPTVSRFEQRVLEACHIRGLHPFTKVPMNLTLVNEQERFIAIPDQLYIWFSGMSIPPERINWFDDPMPVNRALVVELRGPPHRKAARYLHDCEEARRLGMIPQIELLPYEFENGTKKEFQEAMKLIAYRIKVLGDQHGPTPCVSLVGD